MFTGVVFFNLGQFDALLLQYTLERGNLAGCSLEILMHMSDFFFVFCSKISQLLLMFSGHSIPRCASLEVLFLNRFLHLSDLRDGFFAFRTKIVNFLRVLPSSIDELHILLFLLQVFLFVLLDQVLKLLAVVFSLRSGLLNFLGCFCNLYFVVGSHFLNL